MPQSSSVQIPNAQRIPFWMLNQNQPTARGFIILLESMTNIVLPLPNSSIKMLDGDLTVSVYQSSDFERSLGSSLPA